VFNQETAWFDSQPHDGMIFHQTMKRGPFFQALALGIAASALILTSCSTPESRISKNPEIS